MTTEDNFPTLADHNNGPDAGSACKPGLSLGSPYRRLPAHSPPCSGVVVDIIGLTDTHSE